MKKTILVTGAAGFLGSHISEALCCDGNRVIGLDNLNDYYDPARKRANLREVQSNPKVKDFVFYQGDIRDVELVSWIFKEFPIEVVIHLAAMAGVRESIKDPLLYYDVNVKGTLILLEACVGRLKSGKNLEKTRKMPLFIFASTSSVYGATTRIPFSESDPCDRPLAPYPASKRAAELIGYAFHNLYGLNFTVLRFFSVYGPRGRPDMIAFKLANSIYFGNSVPLYNDGKMYRDWTYIDDIVAGVVAATERPLGYEVINLGRGEPVLLADFVSICESITGRSPKIISAPMPESDIPYTFADISKARQILNFHPKVSVEEGLRRFLEWYQKAVLGNCNK